MFDEPKESEPLAAYASVVNMGSFSPNFLRVSVSPSMSMWVLRLLSSVIIVVYGKTNLNPEGGDSDQISRESFGAYF